MLQFCPYLNLDGEPLRGRNHVDSTLPMARSQSTVHNGSTRTESHQLLQNEILSLDIGHDHSHPSDVLHLAETHALSSQFGHNRMSRLGLHVGREPRENY